MRNAVRKMPRNVMRKMSAKTTSTGTSAPKVEIEHFMVKRKTLTEGEIRSSIPSVYATQFAHLMNEETKTDIILVDPAITELKQEVDMTRMTMLAESNNDVIVDVSVLKAEVEHTRSNLMSVASSARVAISLNAWQHRARAAAMARRAEAK